MLEIPSRQAHSLVMEGAAGIGSEGEEAELRRWSHQERRAAPDRQIVGFALDRSKATKSLLGKDSGRDGATTATAVAAGPSDMEMLKERFAKLLLGEDMSGGGKGVSSALALSNAITNLAASIFGEQWRLEPVSVQRKTRWRKEMDWLLSVTDHIVEFVPSQQISKDGASMEIMVTRQRKDLHMNIPALRKLDAMLFGYLDNFKDQNEFWYASKDDDDDGKNGKRKDDKWWLPTAKVTESGLSEVTRKWLQYQKELVNQVLKAAMAINAQVLMEMEIPEAYIESLPKNGRASLGDQIYKSITDDMFDPEDFLSSMDMSTEHKVLDLKNRIEASIFIWKKKMTGKEGKSHWGSAISLEKREQFEDRAETILLLLKLKFPGIPQSSLDISKIQDNRDVGQSILESYSRILESLAFTVMSRIEDVLEADRVARDGSQRRSTSDSNAAQVSSKKLVPEEEAEKLSSMGTPPQSMTLSDFMGWHLKQDAEAAERKDSGSLENVLNTEDASQKKPLNLVTNKFSSYMEKLEALGGLRSPTSRQ